MRPRDWLKSTDARELLRYLNGWARASDRKYRLFAAALCRQFSVCLSESSRIAVEVSERYCDGAVSEAECERAAANAFDAFLGHRTARARRTLDGSQTLAEDAANLAFSLAAVKSYGGSYVAAEALKLVGRFASNYPAESILRDIFGNPFRPVAFDPSWRTYTAVSLARQLYESRDSGPMPILADALEDAGCDHADILAHCRDANAVHVRGCWVVDLVLGKS